MRNKYISLKVTAWLFIAAFVFAVAATVCQSDTLEDSAGPVIESVVVAPTPAKQAPSGAVQGNKEHAPEPSAMDGSTQAIAKAVGDYPSPYAPIAAAVISAVAGAFAAWQNRQKVNMELIRNVELVKRANASDTTFTDEDINFHLACSQKEAGVHRAIRSLIEKEEKERKKASSANATLDGI